MIVTNSTVSRPHSLKNHTHNHEIGGLTGTPLKDMSTEMIRDMYTLTGGMPD